MTHIANNPRVGKVPTYLLPAVAALALGLTVSAHPAEAATQTNQVARSEHVTSQRLATNQLVSSAHGTLTFTLESDNPYTPDPSDHQTITYTEKNPLIQPLASTTLLKKDGNKLTSGKFAFGFIDTTKANPTTHFLKYNPKTMRFSPAKGGHQVRWVKFPDMPDSSVGLDYSRPLQANGQSYTNELFGLSAPQGTNPNPRPPQL